MPLVTLHPLAELVSANDRRRKALENIDRIAQGAIDTTRTYMNKNGDEITIEAPDWSNALKAQIAGAALLGLTEAIEQDKPTAETPVDRIRRLAAVPKAQGGSG